ncbi:hypothetical protein RF11_07036 [Thelohanellus kitauei]|uniref:Uncharacterized protein n=1 Tax=Thelohanellus kitauei TaxID=669202 RepID=A0A0C2NEQ1_THEKT|nr:hypothetical protein RF11_07036 [Thelohanellus kitauei]
MEITISREMKDTTDTATTTDIALTIVSDRLSDHINYSGRYYYRVPQYKHYSNREDKNQNIHRKFIQTKQEHIAVTLTSVINLELAGKPCIVQMYGLYNRSLYRFDCDSLVPRSLPLKPDTFQNRSHSAYSTNNSLITF